MNDTVYDIYIIMLSRRPTSYDNDEARVWEARWAAVALGIPLRVTVDISNED